MREIEKAFYRRNVAQWRSEQDRIRQRIQRRQKADENYIEQGIRLLEIAQDAQWLFQEKGHSDLTGRVFIYVSFAVPMTTRWV